MKFVVVLVLIKLSVCFQSPLPADLWHFGVSVEEFHGIYYLITTNFSRIAIQTSNDLENWSNSTTILSYSEGPGWMTGFRGADLFISPDGDFFVYFETYSGIGAARSKTFNGPYYISDTPLLSAKENELFECISIFYDNIELIMYYQFVLPDESIFQARQLSPNGMSFLSDEVHQVNYPDMTKYNKTIDNRKVFKKQSHYYIIHGCLECHDLYVARSLGPFGPFQSHANVNIFQQDNMKLLEEQENRFHIRSENFPLLCDVLELATNLTLLLYSEHNLKVLRIMRNVTAKMITWDKNGWPIMVSEINVNVTENFIRQDNITERDKTKSSYKLKPIWVITLLAITCGIILTVVFLIIVLKCGKRSLSNICLKKHRDSAVVVYSIRSD